MIVLGLTHLEPYSFIAHDSAVALIEDGRVISAAEEERFTKIKHSTGYPAMAVDWIMKENGISWDDIDYVALPWSELKTSAKTNLMRMGYSLIENIDHGFRRHSFNLSKIKPNSKIGKKLVRVPHQLSHASAAFRSSGFKRASIIALDGAGIDEEGVTTGGIFAGKNGEIEKISSIKGTSLGFFYGLVTEALGWTFADNEGKTMGLASYGKSGRCYDVLKKLAPYVEGLGLKGHCYRTRFRIFNSQFKMSFLEYHQFASLAKKYGRENFAAAAQKILEEDILRLAQNVFEQTGYKEFALGGGVFLNVKANKVLMENGFEIFSYPNCGDAGNAVGAALDVCFEKTGNYGKKRIENVYHGPEFSNNFIKAVMEKFGGKIRYEYMEDNDIATQAAEMINKSNVVGWFQGKMEWGPRALGNRSVLSHPSDVMTKDRLNIQLKEREEFMPFCPSILDESKEKYLVNARESPFMILSFDVPEEAKNEMAAVVHVDWTCRPQTVKKNVNPRYYNLIREFGKLSGSNLILNTSFNKHGLPMVCDPQDAVYHLLWKCFDVLILGNYLVRRGK